MTMRTCSLEHMEASLTCTIARQASLTQHTMSLSLGLEYHLGKRVLHIYNKPDPPIHGIYNDPGALFCAIAPGMPKSSCP